MTPQPPKPLRVAVYARVSTTRQAEGDLSIPDQLRAAEAHCTARGWHLVERFVEPGASGTDDSRPVFQAMLDRATSRPPPFDAIVVHSLSRFARDLVTLELAARRLSRLGVRLVSMTQETPDDANGELMRRIIAAIDEHHSRENANHTLRAMRENARQGYWNGAPPPFGHRIAEAGQKGAHIKKILVVEEAEAAIVQRIFALHLGAAGVPLGVKAIAAQLNREGVKFRGRPFSTSNVHRVLTGESAAGTYHFNRVDSRTRRQKPREEWVAMAMPPIVPREMFDRVQDSLAARAPDRTPPRVVSGPILLTGLAVCGGCGAGMILRTGKGGRYRYYTCAGCALRGRSVCPGRSLPMDPLDVAVTEAVAEQVLRPERLEAILAAFMSREADQAGARREALARARKEATEAEGAKARLMRLVATGALDSEDAALGEELRAAEVRRRRAMEQVALLEAQAGPAMPARITGAKVRKLGDTIRAALASGSPEFRRAWLRMFVSRVEVGEEEIRVSGPVTALAEAAARGAEPESAHFHRVWRRKGNRGRKISGESALRRVY